MKFRTTIEPLDHKGLIDHRNGIVLIGSCFSDEVGLCLKHQLFDVTVNPVGTLYNPYSIANALARIVMGREYVGDELFEYQGLWHSWDFHSKFSDPDPRQALEQMNDAIHDARKALSKASTLIITLGSAMLYSVGPENYPVANCHKVPAHNFQLRALYADEMADTLQQIFDGIRQSINPNLKIILTVSPIRHRGYGFEGNMLSKARLIETCHHLVADNPGVCFYFPSFEIMMDDLRDYRFYAADMIHPSDVAVEYIYSIFRQSLMDKATIEASDACQKYTSFLLHRPLSTSKEAIERHNAKAEDMRQSLINQFPYLQQIIDSFL